MRKQIYEVYIGLVVFALALIGCAAAPTPTPTTIPPTATRVPTATLAPTATATKVPPTATTAPSPTSAPKPTIAATTASTGSSVASAAAAGGKETCLACHGTFDKIIADSMTFVAVSGETGSPHRYVPHDAKAILNIPECGNCHTAHPLSPLPTKGSIDVSKVGVEWCYSTCHHQNNFKPCKECHQ